MRIAEFGFGIAVWDWDCELGLVIYEWELDIIGLGIEIRNCEKLLFNMTKVEYIQRGTRLNYYHVTAKLNWLF